MSSTGRSEIVQREIIEDRVLVVVKHSQVDECATPSYSLEQCHLDDDGASSPPVRYGTSGFADIDSALEFGREWCRESARVLND